VSAVGILSVLLLSLVQAQDAEEKARISFAVRTLVRELDRELLDINQMSESYADYAELCVALRMWLTEKPDVDELQACMRRIKLLKSKLRHLLADRADAQEVICPWFVEVAETSMTALLYDEIV